MSRLRSAAALELRVQNRYGIVPVAAGLAVLWTAVLLALPVGAAATAAPFLLFVDTAGFGALFIVALSLFERLEGSRQALAATPLRTGEGVGVRIAVLTALSVLIALPMLLASARDRFDSLPQVLALSLSGVALTALLLLTLCLAIGARRRELSGFLLVMPLVLAPMIVVPLLRLAGVWVHPAAYLVPSTAGADLILLGMEPGAVDPLPLAAGVLYTLAWVWAGALLARRAVERGSAPGGPPPSRAGGAAGAPRTPVTGRGSVPAVVRFARADLFGSARDPLLPLMLCSPVLLALAIRFLFPAVSEYLGSSYGFDLAAHTPAVLAALVLLHVPMMFGVLGGLRAVEDAEENVLPVLRVSPLSLSAYLGYRTGTVAVLSLAGLAVALPVSGLAAWSPGLAAAALLGALQAPVLLLVMTAWAASKVEALVVVKAAGAVMVLAPVLLWALPEPWGYALLALPPSWAALALPGYAPEGFGPWWFLAGGLLVTALVGVLLLNRTRRRWGAAPPKRARGGS